MCNVIPWIKTKMEQEQAICDNMSIMDILYQGYLEQGREDEPSIRQEFARIDAVLSRLTLKEYDRVWDAACRLCSEHERRGFPAGVRMGVSLMLELRDNDP